MTVTTPCRICNRETIITVDEHGKTIVLDAKARVYNVENDPDSRVTFWAKTDASRFLALHSDVCRGDAG